MDIVNNTNQDAKVRVAGGGAGMAPYNNRVLEDEDPSIWPSLPAGGFLNHSPLPPPWTVCFVVNGRRIRKEVKSTVRKVTLANAGSAFRVDVE
jgi:hypothetical protein